MRYFLAFFFSFFLLCYLVSMAEPVWGLLAKAQDNAQLITEAIAEAIAAHEADPEAHMGEGESIYLHRFDPVLDHPAVSVLPDKRSTTDMQWDFPFLTLDAFGTAGSATIDNLKLNLYVENPSPNFSAISGEVISQPALDNRPSSILLDVSCYFLDAQASTAYISFSGLRFDIENNRVRGNIFLTGMSSPVITDWYSVDMTKLHNLFAVFFVLEGVVRLYVDGDLFAEEEVTYEPNDDAVSFEARHDRNSASDNSFYLTKLRFALYEFQPVP